MGSWWAVDMRTKVLVFAFSLLCSVSTTFQALGAGIFRIVMRDGSEFIGAIHHFEDGMYGLSLPIGDRIVAVADVRRIDVIGAGPPPKDGEAGVPKPLAVVPEYQLLIGESRSVVGSMRSFEDGIYEIETRFGPVRVPVADVTRIDVTWMSALGETGVAIPDGGSVLAQGQLRFAGSNVMGESLVPALLEAYVAHRRALSTLWVSGTTAHERSLVALALDRKRFVASINRKGTASAWEALIDGSADIGMMSRQMSSEESQRFAAARPGKPPIQVEEQVVALGGVVVLVHPSNPVKLLRLDQIADIFSGRVRNWSEFGGVPRRIRVIAPPEGSGILEVFRARVLHGRAIDPLIARTSSNTEISVLVGSDPTAIGLSEFAYVRNATAIAITDECGLTHTPSEFSIQTEEYPLSTQLYLYAKENSGPEVQRFVDFVLSTPGQSRLREHGHVSLLPTLASQGMPIERAGAIGSDAAARQEIVKGLMAYLEKANRLSVTFRFVSGSVDLDTRGVADLDRLVAFLKGEVPEGRRVALLGFSDRAGTVATNEQLAMRRARFLAQKLKDKGAKVDRAFGFGSLLPVACDTVPEGRATNRRVEVWLN